MPFYYYLRAAFIVLFFGVMTDAASAQFTTIINLPPNPDIGNSGSIGSYTQLNLAAGGKIGTHFHAGSSLETSVNVNINITGGDIGFGFEAFRGSTINMSGGLLGDGSFAFKGSTLNISGGIVGNHFEASSRSRVNLTGGSIGSSFNARAESVVSIYGGMIGEDFDADFDSKIRLYGSQFLLDGVDITDSLAIGIPSLITDRDVSLTGQLADGSAFDFELNSTNPFFQDYFHPGSILTIFRVEVGDFNANNKVDGADFLKWQRGLATYLALGDLADWESNFGTPPSPSMLATTYVPEPNAGALLVVSLVVVMMRRSRFAAWQPVSLHCPIVQRIE